MSKLVWLSPNRALRFLSLWSCCGLAHGKLGRVLLTLDEAEMPTLSCKTGRSRALLNAVGVWGAGLDSLLPLLLSTVSLVYLLLRDNDRFLAFTK